MEKLYQTHLDSEPRPSSPGTSTLLTVCVECRITLTLPLQLPIAKELLDDFSHSSILLQETKSVWLAE